MTDHEEGKGEQFPFCRKGRNRKDVDSRHDSVHGQGELAAAVLNLVSDVILTFPVLVL
jgi:hypothetical protein